MLLVPLDSWPEKLISSLDCIKFSRFARVDYMIGEPSATKVWQLLLVFGW